MDPEKKEPVVDTTQAPAQSGTAPEKKEEAKQGEGIEAIAKDPKRLRELYNKSPQMFKDAGLDLKEEKKPEEKKEEKPKSADTKPESAAPKAKVAKYADKDITLPDDLPVNEASVQAHFDHWKENGFSPEQVQKEVDFMTKAAREDKKARDEKAQAAKTPAQVAKEEDDQNVKILQNDPEFGKEFKKNMETARRAAIKYGNKDSLSKLATSDPTWVKHFWDLGKLDAEEKTPLHGKPRTGDEGQSKEEQDQKNPKSPSRLRKRYNNSPDMNFGDE